MEKLGVCAAKRRFYELIRRAEAGRTTFITRRGHIVAKIEPAKKGAWDRSAILDQAETLRKRLAIRDRFKIAQALHGR